MYILIRTLLLHFYISGSESDSKLRYGMGKVC